MKQRIGFGRSPRLVALGTGLVLVVVAACAGAQASPTPPATTPAPTEATTSAPTEAPDLYAETCEAGVEEGRWVHWHNHSDEFQKVLDAFTAAHPGIEIEDLGLRPDEMAQRILTETAAGRPPTPDSASGGLDVFNAVIERDLVATDVDWAGMGVPADQLHSRNFVRNHRIAMGLTYNTDKLTAEDLPDTWEELIDPKWRGRAIVDSRGRPFDNFVLVWGEERTLDYVNRLKETVAPLVIEGGTAGLVATAGGEADFTTGGRSAETLEQQARGAPLEIKYLDLVMTQDSYGLVMKDARHPNAARCFFAWFAREGQEIYNEVEFKTNDPIPPDAPPGAEVISIESAEDAELVQQMSTEISRIWAGQ